MFCGPQWAAHRWLWRRAAASGAIRKLLLAWDHLPAWLARPLRMLRLMQERRAAARCARGGATLGEALGTRDASRIASALGSHACAFSWRESDVLLINNRRVLHDGMPGFGPRKLHVVIFDGMEPAAQSSPGGVLRDPVSLARAALPTTRDSLQGSTVAQRKSR